MIRLIKRIIDKANNLNTFKGQVELGKKVIIRSSKVAGNVEIGKYSKVINSDLFGNIIIGDHSKVLNADIKGNVILGRYCSIAGQGTTISSQINSISIGSFCSIAANCTILEFNHPITKLSTFYIGKHIFNEGTAKNDRESKGSIEIGNDVWVGANAVILSGVKIGNGVIIGANSVVTSDVPDYAIIGGVPAKVIKYRFEEEVISLLNRICWWGWSTERILENKVLFEKGSIKIEDLAEFSK